MTWREIFCTLEIARDCITDGRIKDAVDLRMSIEPDFEWLGVTFFYKHAGLRRHARNPACVIRQYRRDGREAREIRYEAGWRWPEGTVPVASIQPSPASRDIWRLLADGVAARDVQ